MKALTDIVKGVLTDGFTPMNQMLPAPALGLLGKVQVAARTDHHSQEQAQKEAARRNCGIGAAAAHRAHGAAETKNFGNVAQKLSQFVHQDAATSGSPRRSSS